MTIVEQLSLITTNHNNASWLAENENDVHDTLLQAIREKNALGIQAINELILTFPQYLSSEHIKVWHKLNRRAFRWVRKWKSNKTIQEVRQMYVFTPQPAPRVIDRKRRSERIDSHELFELYLDLTMKNFFAHPEVFTSEMANSILHMTRQINVTYYTYKIQQILALLFSYVNEFERATDALNISYNYWLQQDNSLELGLNAYILGKVRQAQKDPEAALYSLKASLKYFESIDYPEQKKVVHRTIEQLSSNS